MKYDAGEVVVECETWEIPSYFFIEYPGRVVSRSQVWSHHGTTAEEEVVGMATPIARRLSGAHSGKFVPF